MSRDAGAIWKTMDADARAPFELQAKEAKREHMLKYPGYRYTPRKLDGLNSCTAGSVSRRAAVAATNVMDVAEPSARSTYTRKINLRLPTPEPSDVEGEYDELMAEESSIAEECMSNSDAKNSGDEYRDMFPGIYIPKSQTKTEVCSYTTVSSCLMRY